jgi:hypothetical protein
MEALTKKAFLVEWSFPNPSLYLPNYHLNCKKTPDVILFLKTLRREKAGDVEHGRWGMIDKRGKHRSDCNPS